VTLLDDQRERAGACRLLRREQHTKRSGHRAIIANR
jgi:hypothetical protein